MAHALLILGNQLFDPTRSPLKGRKFDRVYMREDIELCAHFKYHKLKIALFLMAMRSFADELKIAGHKVDYETLLPSKKSYETHFKEWLKKNSVKKITLFEIEDKFFEKRILKALDEAGVESEILRTPMFLTSRDQFQSYLKKTKRPFMRTFYEQQRKRLKIMVDENDQPSGGKWSFDELNRKPLPRKEEPPRPTLSHKSPHEADVVKLIARHFSDHPGEIDEVWFATDRKGAAAWLDQFLEERFANFGPYEDALAPHSDFVFHSVLTPYLNTGLLTPDTVVQSAIRFANKRKLNISSVEGFVRQIIGWREFVRGIYQNFSETQDESNFFKHHRKLTNAWYEGTTGIEPLDHVIKKTGRYGYAHHIERLMVVGNLMVLCEVDPHEAHRWFMEMFIDSSDWVMGPNVYGMAIFSDGGIFATKPYICGSNYYRNMGGFKAAPWCDGVDGLYWGFIEKHSEFFSRNPRLSMMVRTVEKMDYEKKKRIYAAARKLKNEITTKP
jgi:deoxyribodipyrimidine photolyase-related protein